MYLLINSLITNPCPTVFISFFQKDAPFKIGFAKRAGDKKADAEVLGNVKGFEPEIKIEIDMCKVADDGQLSEAEHKAIDEVLSSQGFDLVLCSSKTAVLRNSVRRRKIQKTQNGFLF